MINNGYLLTLTVYQDFEECTSTTCFDVTVTQRKVFDSFVNGKAISKGNHSFASEVVVIKFEDLKISIGFREHKLADKLTAKRSDLVI